MIENIVFLNYACCMPFPFFFVFTTTFYTARLVLLTLQLFIHEAAFCSVRLYAGGMIVVAHNIKTQRLLMR